MSSSRERRSGGGGGRPASSRGRRDSTSDIDFDEPTTSPSRGRRGESEKHQQQSESSNRANEINFDDDSFRYDDEDDLSADEGKRASRLSPSPPASRRQPRSASASKSTTPRSGANVREGGSRRPQQRPLEEDAPARQSSDKWEQDYGDGLSDLSDRDGERGAQWERAKKRSGEGRAAAARGDGGREGSGEAPRGAPRDAGEKPRDARDKSGTSVSTGSDVVETRALMAMAKRLKEELRKERARSEALEEELLAAQDKIQTFERQGNQADLRADMAALQEDLEAMGLRNKGLQRDLSKARAQGQSAQGQTNSHSRKPRTSTHSDGGGSEEDFQENDRAEAEMENDDVTNDVTKGRSTGRKERGTSQGHVDKEPERIQVGQLVMACAPSEYPRVFTVAQVVSVDARNRYDVVYPSGAYCADLSRRCLKALSTSGEDDEEGRGEGTKEERSGPRFFKGDRVELQSKSSSSRWYEGVVIADAEAVKPSRDSFNKGRQNATEYRYTVKVRADNPAYKSHGQGQLREREGARVESSVPEGRLRPEGGEQGQGLSHEGGSASRTTSQKKLKVGQAVLCRRKGSSLEWSLAQVTESEGDGYYSVTFAKQQHKEDRAGPSSSDRRRRSNMNSRAVESLHFVDIRCLPAAVGMAHERASKDIAAIRLQALYRGRSARLLKPDYGRVKQRKFTLGEVVCVSRVAKSRDSEAHDNNEADEEPSAEQGAEWVLGVIKLARHKGHYDVCLRADGEKEGEGGEEGEGEVLRNVPFFLLRHVDSTDRHKQGSKQQGGKQGQQQDYQLVWVLPEGADATDESAWERGVVLREGEDEFSFDVRVLAAGPGGGGQSKGGEEDGEEEVLRNVPCDRLREHKRTRAKKHKVGDVVMAEKDGEWREARVVDTLSGGWYVVELDNGEHPEDPENEEHRGGDGSAPKEEIEVKFTSLRSKCRYERAAARAKQLAVKKIKQRRFYFEDLVLARLPKSNVWRVAQVKRVSPEGGKYDVKFADGEVAEDLSFRLMRHMKVDLAGLEAGEANEDGEQGHGLEQEQGQKQGQKEAHKDSKTSNSSSSSSETSASSFTYRVGDPVVAKKSRGSVAPAWHFGSVTAVGRSSPSGRSPSEPVYDVTLKALGEEDDSVVIKGLLAADIRPMEPLEGVMGTDGDKEFFNEGDMVYILRSDYARKEGDGGSRGHLHKWGGRGKHQQNQQEKQDQAKLSRSNWSPGKVLRVMEAEMPAAAEHSQSPRRGKMKQLLSFNRPSRTASAAGSELDGGEEVEASVSYKFTYSVRHTPDQEAQDRGEEAWTEEDVPRERLRPRVLMRQKKMVEGEEVMVQGRGRRKYRWEDATIVTSHKDRTYTVKFGDGAALHPDQSDEQLRMPFTMIRLRNPPPPGVRSRAERERSQRRREAEAAEGGADEWSSRGTEGGSQRRQENSQSRRSGREGGDYTRSHGSEQDHGGSSSGRDRGTGSSLSRAKTNSQPAGGGHYRSGRNKEEQGAGYRVEEGEEGEEEDEEEDARSRPKDDGQSNGQRRLSADKAALAEAKRERNRLFIEEQARRQQEERAAQDEELRGASPSSRDRERPSTSKGRSSKERRPVRA